MQKLIVILGPTASGKSDIAVKLAKKLNGEVISADSRQVYKGLDIGTGKITRRETSGVKHHLLDVASPLRLRSGQAQRFTAAEFKKRAEKAIVEVTKKGKLPIICGGTGFYIDALLGDKQIPEVPPDPRLRKELEKKTAQELFEMLKKLDMERARNIDAKNPRRLVRAIEICKALGTAPKQIQNYKFQITNKFQIIKIGVKIPNEDLKKRINKRIEKWFKQGLLKEVQNLYKRGLSWKRMSEIGLEYKIVSLFLQNKISKEEMIKRMRSETWRYAKRQMTWFKKTKDVVWLPPKISDILRAVNKGL